MQDEWRDNPNFAGPASTLLGIHGQFRAAADRLLLFLERKDDDEIELGFVARAYVPLATTLHHHHHAEEMMLFPMIAKKTGTAPARLEADHKELTDAIAHLETALRGTDRPAAITSAKAFHRILNDHLDREEELVVPVLLTMTPNEAWAMIHGD